MRLRECIALCQDAENRLASATKNSVSESYAYDVDGSRIKKVSGGVNTTYTWFPFYEQEGGTVVKHYSFAGQRVAVKRGGTLSYIHGDHLGSSSIETDGSGNQTASRSYYAYGSTRSSSGSLQTDRTFTGQKSDGTGLLYYNARYYDPQLGTFLSPDTVVPDPGAVIDYNRFLYVRGNPLKYADPSGNEPSGPQFDGGGSCLMPGSCWSTDGWINDDGSPLDDSLFGILSELLSDIPSPSIYYNDDGTIDWNETGNAIADNLGDALSSCAQDVGGVCGASYGVSAGVGAGGRLSIEIYADANEIGLFGSVGGGAYVPLTVGTVEVSRLSAVAVRNATIDDMKKMSAQLGVAGKLGPVGGNVEWIMAKNSQGQSMHGLSLGQASGAGIDFHFTATYTFEIMSGRYRNE